MNLSHFILVKKLIELQKYTFQDDPDAVGEVTKKLYGDLCSQLHLTSLLPCLVDLCRSLCGIMQSYKSIYNWHVNQDSCGTQEYVLKKLSNGFPRIWQDVQTKVKLTYCKSKFTRKYPLCGYFLGVLKHTNAWDRLWGGDVFLRLYIRSSASPCLTAV